MGEFDSSRGIPWLIVHETSLSAPGESADMAADSKSARTRCGSGGWEMDSILERPSGTARRLAVLREELHDVVEAETTVATLAHAVKRELATIAEALHRVDVQVKHVGNFGCGEHRSQFIYGHRCHLVCSLALHILSTGQVPCGAQG